jgi:hypothetical protein
MQKKRLAESAPPVPSRPTHLGTPCCCTSGCRPRRRWSPGGCGRGRRRGWALGLLDGLHGRGAGGRLPPSLPTAPPPPCLARLRCFARSSERCVLGFPTHALGRDTHVPRASPAEEKDGASHSRARPALKSSTHCTCGVDLRVEDLHGGEGAGVCDLGGHR